MKVPREKPELVASTDKTRRIITSVNLRIQEETIGRGKSKRVERKGYLEATDSYRAVIVPVEISDSDMAGLIDRRALKTARAEKTEEIQANGTVSVAVAGGQLQLDRPEGEYPDMVKIAKFEGEPVFSIGLNPELLLGVAKALGVPKDQGLMLEFFDPLKPIKVTYPGAPDALGVLMPVRMVQR